ncbi:class I SAM-dependent methyltransferase [Alkalicaulis satelles]|uniref:Class I SAM-dependent methyltransferase n=1 Tax=Alkalicaulis satelles TaxID=2609175 RepID=A0A5M6ZGR9_9PROT|nr:class I SAM-dependent methyltransferase [Alkalicaulis satelles]KAA5803405.1 class I SAM-dependent methyltransferase [Alkalicaulis satelles]
MIAQLYETHVLPHLIGCACGAPQIMKQRARLIPEARGRVLEIGFGSGTNLGFYDPSRVSEIVALEPSEGMRRKAAPAIAQSPVSISWRAETAEAAALEPDSFDTLVLTYTACTIPDPDQALAALRRALKPGGQLLFCEHGLAPDEGVARWQRRIEPVWKPLAGGCRLTRDPAAMIARAGFSITRMEADYLPKTPKIAGYTVRGAASR